MTTLSRMWGRAVLFAIIVSTNWIGLNPLRKKKCKRLSSDWTQPCALCAMTVLIIVTASRFYLHADTMTCHLEFKTCSSGDLWHVFLLKFEMRVLMCVCRTWFDASFVKVLRLCVAIFLCVCEYLPHAFAIMWDFSFDCMQSACDMEDPWRGCRYACDVHLCFLTYRDEAKNLSCVFWVMRRIRCANVIGQHMVWLCVVQTLRSVFDFSQQQKICSS